MKYQSVTLLPGDVLRGTRYLLLFKQLHIPSSQQGQRTDWLASDTQSTGRRVIVHQITLGKCAPSEQEQLIQTVTRQLTELAQHPGFLPITDEFQERGDYYIVQPYPEGESLASLLKQRGGTLPEREVAEYGLQLCAMLALLAQFHPPSINGSLSPETIFISSEKHQVWLLHFPCFPLQATPQKEASTGYLFPEQVQGESDLYSLAATLHRAVTGYDSHEHLAFSYPPARRLNPTVTPRMEALLARALRLSAQQRFTHLFQMQQELSDLIASYSPISPSLSAPLLLERAQTRQQRLEKSRRRFGILGGLAVALLLLFVTLTAYPLLINNLPAMQQALHQKALDNELKLEFQAYQTKDGIGLSDGRLIFDLYPDRTKADIDLKQRAATALRQGRIGNALRLMTQATTVDPADGEAQIYNEDLQILQSGAPSVTVVLGLSICKDPTRLLIARADLEGAFLAQQRINSQNSLPHGLRLRLLIANSGNDDATVTTTTQFIANRVVQASNLDHIIAVVGWPTSEESLKALDILSAIHLPMVSQTASSNKLSGSSPYFFRVISPDDQQGKTLGTFAVQQLHAKNVLVLQDPGDTYSVSLASGFSNSLKANQTNVFNAPDNFTEQTTTVAQYKQTTIPYAIARRVDLIFLAGSDVDGIRLAHALGEIARAHPMNSSLANLKILGGDHLDTGMLLGQGNDPDAALAANFPQDIQRLIFADFAHPDEQSHSNGSLANSLELQQFFINWFKTYQGVPPSATKAPSPECDAILTYDAIDTLQRAAILVPDSLIGQRLRDALVSLGQRNTSAYEGISGSISFDAQGNPIDKALVILDVENKNGQNMIALQQLMGRFC